MRTWNVSMWLAGAGRNAGKASVQCEAKRPNKPRRTFTRQIRMERARRLSEHLYSLITARQGEGGGEGGRGGGGVDLYHVKYSD